MPPPLRDRLPAIFETVKEVFVLGMHETFYVGALICLVALGFSFLMQNPGRRTAAAHEPQMRESVPHSAAAD